MKKNYYLYLAIILIILFRSSLVNLLNNTNQFLYIKPSNLEINLLKKDNARLLSNYEKLSDFKNNLQIKEKYFITNLYLNNYGFDKFLINGSNYKINDEVVTDEGLVGIIYRICDNYSEVNFLSKTNIPVLINDETGKIVGEKDGNLIIKEVTNYNNIKLNDMVKSSYGTYIGKVIKKNALDIDSILIVKPVNNKHLKYVAIISR